MATPKTGNPRGRPKKSFLEDPDRYLIAYAHCLGAMGFSENKAFLLSVVSFETNVISRKQTDDGRWHVCFEKPLKPGSFARFDGRISTLRLKANKKDPVSGKEAYWRLYMPLAISLAVSGASYNLARAGILEFCLSAGEDDFAQEVLLPHLNFRATIGNCREDLPVALLFPKGSPIFPRTRSLKVCDILCSSTVNVHG